MLTHDCLCGRERETTSLISFPGGVKANEPAFWQRVIIIIIIIIINLTSIWNSDSEFDNDMIFIYDFIKQ